MKPTKQEKHRTKASKCLHILLYTLCPAMKLVEVEIINLTYLINSYKESILGQPLI